jgi:hypothetical protein
MRRIKAYKAHRRLRKQHLDSVKFARYLKTSEINESCSALFLLPEIVTQLPTVDSKGAASSRRLRILRKVALEFY